MSVLISTVSVGNERLFRLSPSAPALPWSRSSRTPAFPGPNRRGRLPLRPRADDAGAWNIALVQRGVRVLTFNGDDLTDGSDPSRKMMRQIAGAFAEYPRLSVTLGIASDPPRAVARGGSRAADEEKVL